MSLKNVTDFFEEIIELGYEERFKNLTSKEKEIEVRNKFSDFISQQVLEINNILVSDENHKDAEVKADLIFRSLKRINKWLAKPEMLHFLEKCDFSKSEAKYLLTEALNDDSLNNNILKLLSNFNEISFLQLLKEYRESPQARRDIKNNKKETEEKLEILKPFLSLLSETTSPSYRMELWQKIELYFKSGWGMDDLTNNSSNSETAKELKNLLSESKLSKSVITLDSEHGKKILDLLETRINELGVPIQVENERNILNGEDIPTAKFISKDKVSHKWNKKRTLGAKWVDWALPDFHNPEILHLSLATSDETCAMENSQLFRYRYAIEEALKKEESKFKKVKLSFFSVSTFYDEFDLDQTQYFRPQAEIGQAFIERYGITKEQRKELNIAPFLGMANKISSNCKTGIYSPSQLIDYNFCILGAESLIENDEKKSIENLFKNCIETIVTVFEQDKIKEVYTDSKSLEMLNHLYNILSSARNEFYDNKDLMDFLSSEELYNKLSKINTLIPNSQNSKTSVNKNDFSNLIENIYFMSPEKVCLMKQKAQIQYLEEQERIKNLTGLVRLINEHNALNKQINSEIYKLPENYAQMSKPAKAGAAYDKMLEVYMICESPNAKHSLAFMDNQTVHDCSAYDYYLSPPMYYKHKEYFSAIDKEKDPWQDKPTIYTNWKKCSKTGDWSVLDDGSKKNDLLLKLMYCYARHIHGNEFEEFSLPSAWTLIRNSRVAKHYDSTKLETSIKEFNNMVKYGNQEDIDKIIAQNETIKKLQINLKEQIEANYNDDEIKFVCKKMNVNENVFLKAIKNKPV